MAEINLDALKSVEQLPPLVFIAGKENFLIDRAMHRIIEIGVAEETRDFNLDILYGSEVGARRIIEIAKSFPMMAEKRVLIVKDIQKMAASDLKGLAQHIENPTQSTCLTLIARTADLRKKVFATLKEKAAFINCKPLYENQVVSWIQKEVQSLGYQIEPPAAQTLAMQVGTNLRELMNEIQKLILFIGGRKQIRRNDVAEVAGFRKEYSIFSLQNALGDRKLGDALQIYQHIRAAIPIQVILSQLGRFFTNLLIAKGFTPGTANNKQLSGLTRVSPYFIRDLHKFKRNYSISEIMNALENLRAVDFSLKNYSVDEHALIELLLIQITKGLPARRLPFSGRI